MTTETPDQIAVINAVSLVDMILVSILADDFKAAKRHTEALGILLNRLADDMGDFDPKEEISVIDVS